mmetsp:Transcript_21924/g.49016  ORF Transcript_21924/g.49016 Transcript_21924/m.49016 type:complete len:926 (+) Transcript_21924:375-3152(+)
MNQHYRAIETLREILQMETAADPPCSMKLTALSTSSRWHIYFARNLGTIKRWYKDTLPFVNLVHYLELLEDRGPGNDVMLWTGPAPARRAVSPLSPGNYPGEPQHLREEDRDRDFTSQLAQMHIAERGQQQRGPPGLLRQPVPLREDWIDLDLYRDFDSRDDFFHDRFRHDKILESRTFYWSQRHLWELPLSTLPDQRQKELFDRAFNKATRLTISISYVLHHEQVSFFLRNLLNPYLSGGQLFLWVATNRGDNMFIRDVFATIWAPGQMKSTAGQPLNDIINAMANNDVRLMGKFLQVYHCGRAPTKLGLIAAVREVCEEERRKTHYPPAPASALASALASLDAGAGGGALLEVSYPPRGAMGVIMDAGALPLAPVTSPLPPPLPESAPWPKEVTYEGLFHRVVPEDNPALVAQLEKIRCIKLRLEQECNAQRALPENKRKLYSEEEQCEWIGDDHPENGFKLGEGAEAIVYYGLFSDPRVPGTKELVAVKQSKSGQKKFESQERQHYIAMREEAGIVKYHRGFDLDLGRRVKPLDILVIELGLMNLAELRKECPDLSPQVKFKLTKALTLAVEKLHQMDPPILHRDIRPENVLVMMDGTVKLTDFGLARRTPQKGSSVHTLNLLTTMQPYEVQAAFGAEVSVRGVFSAGVAADVFMLGLVLAFVHTGRDAFRSDTSIMQKQCPYLPGLSPWLEHLLGSMLSHEHEARPSIEMVLRHPYFLSHHQNFDENLRVKVECVVVAGCAPLDNREFQMMEKLLAPIESRLRRESSNSWHQQLPAALFTGNGQLPRRIPAFDTFRGTGVGTGAGAAAGHSPPPRPYPLPLTAQLVKWLRNMLQHFHAVPAQRDALRRSLAEHGASDYYENPGEFFSKHPAVQWLLPCVWAQQLAQLQEIQVLQRDKKEKMRKLEAELLQLDDKADAILSM